MPAFRIVVLVGSLREQSFSRRLARAIGRLAPASLEFREADIRALPFYCQDR